MSENAIGDAMTLRERLVTTILNAPIEGYGTMDHILAKSEAEAIADAVLAEIAAAGMVLVLREPTEAMVEAGEMVVVPAACSDNPITVSDVYRAMLSAAPSGGTE